MVFSTPLFLCFFLPASLLLYFVSPRAFRLALLTLLSYGFYAWSGPWFLSLLIWTTLVDYVAGALLAGDFGREPSRAGRRVILGLSIANTLGLLLFFKYGPAVAAGVGGESPLVQLLANVALPAGISFYTFESISYVLDIYHHGARSAASEYLKRAGPAATRCQRAACHVRGLVAFACYISQFPHLVAGPIIRFQELQMQLLHPRAGVRRFSRGMTRFCIGLGKKVLVADTLAAAVDPIFAAGGGHVGYNWCGAAAFALQIYFDFSGYSDMAIGLALMLGFRFPENFASPYKAATLTEFWRRWHMTLSRWLRDYIYIPLGGNRRGPSRTMINLLLTMTIAGVWHGAGLVFLVWGVMHGVVLAIERATGTAASPDRRWRPGRRAVTILFLLVSWVVFRSPSLEASLTMTVMMFNPFALDYNLAAHAAITHWSFLAAMAVGAAIVFFGWQSQKMSKKITPTVTGFAGIVFVVSMVVMLMRTSVPFLYFKF